MMKHKCKIHHYLISHITSLIRIRFWHNIINTFIIVGICSQLSFAQELNQLKKVSFNTLPGNRLQIDLELTAPAVEPLSFTIAEPARIALDLLNTKSVLPNRVVPVGVGLAQTINTAQAKGKTRVVLNLTQMVPYSIQAEGNHVYLTLENELTVGTQTASQQRATTIATTTDTTSTTTQPVVFKRADPSVQGIDFRRGTRGEGRLIVELSDPNMLYNVNEEGGRVVVDFFKSKLPDKLTHRLDVLDFATPVKTIDSFKNGKDVRIVVTPVNANIDHLAYVTGDIFTLEVRPLEKEERDKRIKEKFGYTGERISFDFQDVEVRAALHLFADVSDFNVVISDTVTGNLTLRLRDVPWDQALDVILSNKGLDKRQNGNVLLIAPSEEIATREKLELEAQQQVEELAPLQSEYIRINYAKASDISNLLIGDEGNQLLSARGAVSVDERTNTLLVQDTAEKLDEVRGLILTLDIPVRQVLIESRIVIANDDFNKELGVRFGATRDTRLTALDEGTLSSGNLNAITNVLNAEEVGLTDRMNVNLNTSGDAFGSIAVALARLPLGTLLELELSALQAEGRGEVISSPRVITANQKEAFIEQGVEIPYEVATASGATAIAFRDAVLSLTVTPQITPDDRIIMDLTVKNDTVGEVFGGIPSIDKRRVDTQVLVNNGQTVVLGGIFEQTSSTEEDRVPFFGGLPGIGKLFRRQLTRDDKAELLIFVTPKIISDNFSLEE